MSDDEIEYERPKGLKIYQFTTATWSTGDQAWWAVTEEGEIVVNHISSSRGWGLIDTSPTGMHKDRFERFDEPTMVEMPEGEFPPDEVLLKAGFEWRK